MKPRQRSNTFRKSAINESVRHRQLLKSSHRPQFRRQRARHTTIDHRQSFETVQIGYFRRQRSIHIGVDQGKQRQSRQTAKERVWNGAAERRVAKLSRTRLLKFPISFGIMSSKRTPSRNSFSSAVSWKMAFGKVPVNPAESCRFVNLDSKPTCVGNVPAIWSVHLSVKRRKTCSCDSSPMRLESVPEQRVDEMSKYVKACRSQSSDGSVPTNVTSRKARY